MLESCGNFTKVQIYIREKGNKENGNPHPFRGWGELLQPQFCRQCVTQDTTPVPALSSFILPAMPLLWLVPTSSTGCSAQEENVYSLETLSTAQDNTQGCRNVNRDKASQQPHCILSSSLSGQTGSYT